MISYFSELRYKEVIDIHTGKRLGYVCDAEFDETEGRLISLITPGKAKFFGLFGREDDYILPWSRPRPTSPGAAEKKKKFLTKWQKTIEITLDF